MRVEEKKNRKRIWYTDVECIQLPFGDFECLRTGNESKYMCNMYVEGVKIQNHAKNAAGATEMRT